MVRVILAGIAGGVILFCWGAFSHMVLGLGEVGIKMMPNEAPVMAAMQANMKEPGFYMYPGLEGGHSANEAEMAAWEARYKAGPHGVVIHHPTGSEVMPPSMLLNELLSNILACVLVAFVISMTAAGFLGRMLIAGLFGLVGWLSIDVSYWNWYGFPTDFTSAQAIDQVVGWVLAGVGIAALVKGRSGAH